MVQVSRKQMIWPKSQIAFWLTVGSKWRLGHKVKGRSVQLVVLIWWVNVANRQSEWMRVLCLCFIFFSSRVISSTTWISLLVLEPSSTLLTHFNNALLRWIQPVIDWYFCYSSVCLHKCSQNWPSDLIKFICRYIKDLLPCHTYKLNECEKYIFLVIFICLFWLIRFKTLSIQTIKTLQYIGLTLFILEWVTSYFISYIHVLCMFQLTSIKCPNKSRLSLGVISLQYCISHLCWMLSSHMS